MYHNCMKIKIKVKGYNNNTDQHVLSLKVSICFANEMMIFLCFSARWLRQHKAINYFGSRRANARFIKIAPGITSIKQSTTMYVLQFHRSIR